MCTCNNGTWLCTGQLCPDSGGAEGAVPDANDGGPCTQPLSVFAGCPGTYPVPLPPFICPSPFIGNPITAGVCGAFPAIMIGNTPHYGICVYNGADGGALIGTQSITDINEFCNGTSYTITGGNVPVDCNSTLLADYDDAGGLRIGSCTEAGADAQPDVDGHADAAAHD